ncbi:MAG: arginine--tRNA ligase [Nitrospirota bacterium]
MKRVVGIALRKALEGLGVEAPASVEIEIPREESMGDLSTPVAMGLARTLKRPPREIAEKIARGIPDEGMFERVEVAGPGFINFTFRESFLRSELSRLLKEGPSFLRVDVGRQRKVQIEYVSANPTGPLHLGHGRGAAVGGALSNLLEAAGFDVTREYYVNDAGLQVKLLGQSVLARYRERLGLPAEFPEDGYRGDYVGDIARAIFEAEGERFKDATFEEAGQFFVDFSLNMMLRDICDDLASFGITFDNWQSERALYDSGAVKHAIELLDGKGLIYEKDGAIWFRAMEFGEDKDRVIIKSDGEHTYFASDIAYHAKKIEGGYDELIDIWGADHHGYIPRLEAVIEALGYEKERLKVLLVQMVSLQRGGQPVQMSKRAGEFVTLREVIQEVGADTTKFIFLTRRPDSQLTFDIEAAKAASAENPVYYVQYANARINSIFAHAREQGAPAEGLESADLSPLSEAEETRLIKKLLYYPMAFEAAALSREPHRITFYLQEIAGIFHPYYNTHRVVTDDPALTAARLALCGAVRMVIKEGLRILGITAPDRM